MSILNKLTIKNLKLNKRRTIVTIIGIILIILLASITSTDATPNFSAIVCAMLSQVPVEEP